MVRISSALTLFGALCSTSHATSNEVLTVHEASGGSSRINQCAFCRDDVMQRQTVCENDDFAVLVDYAPISYGHLLVVPKIHATYLQDIPPEKMSSFQELVPKIVQVFEDVIKTNQYIVLQKNGQQAGQSVPHVHFHFIPVASTKWVILAQLKILGKIFFGTRPASKETTDKTIAVFKAAFQNSPPQRKPQESQ